MKARALSLPTVSGLWAAVAALVVACVLVLGALVRALRFQEPTAAAGKIVIPNVASVRGHGDTSRELLDDDLFSPNRTPSATRYQLAQTGSGAPASPNEANPSGGESTPAVLGTVIAPDGAGFAICSIDNGVPRTVRVGGTVGSYTVEKIERGLVVFATHSGRRITVRTTQAGS